jgi:hypothetical protein
VSRREVCDIVARAAGEVYNEVNSTQVRYLAEPRYD